MVTARLIPALLVILSAAGCTPPPGNPVPTATATAVSSDSALPKGPPANIEVVKAAIQQQLETPAVSDLFFHVTSLDVTATAFPDLYAWHAVVESMAGPTPPGQAPFQYRHVSSGTFSWSKQTLSYVGRTAVELSSDQQAVAAAAVARR
jgi:hypothetical protein